MSISSKLVATPTREDTMKFLAESSTIGSLGLFIGAGFSKAFVGGANKPLSWQQLLEKICEEFNLDIEEVVRESNGYPDQASKICGFISESSKITYGESVVKFKSTIARIVNWLPQPETRKKIGDYLNEIDPSWIITTNYDFVIESMLPDRGVQLSPRDTFAVPKGQIPIYHLHGHRLKPDSIVITQEDYIAINRPNDYRQVSLPMKFKESTVVILGYGIGDQNVLTAMDWAKNVFNETNVLIPSDFVQVKWSDNPKSEPYRDKNNVLIIETSDLEHFLNEIGEKIRIQKEADIKSIEIKGKLTEALMDPAQGNIVKFVDDKDFRISMIDAYSRAKLISTTLMIQFLAKCFEITSLRSQPNGAFEGYNQKLSILIDFISHLRLDQIHPLLFEYLADKFDDVAYYVGRDKGQSWAADTTWSARSKEISHESIVELTNYAKVHEKYSLEKLLLKK
ncbi:MAG: SIR2 family NAD-dependent protein deacylase [Bacteriovoracia bacterium]